MLTAQSNARVRVIRLPMSLLRPTYLRVWRSAETAFDHAVAAANEKFFLNLEAELCGVTYVAEAEKDDVTVHVALGSGPLRFFSVCFSMCREVFPISRQFF